MTFLNAVFIYFLVWWITLFMILPLGVERHQDEGLGHDAGAPKIPHLRRKLLLNTALSAIVLGVIYVLVETGVIEWSAILGG
jgi:predicted secreted protein